MRRSLQLWAGLALALFGITCTDRAPTGPVGRGAASFNMAALLARAPGDPPIPADSVRITVRRQGEEFPSLDTTLALSGLAAGGDSARVTLAIEMREQTENVTISITVRGGGVVWYTGTTTATLTAGVTVSPSSPLVMTYVGPGFDADSVRISIAGTQFVGGFPITVGGAVWVPGGILSGVPVGFRVGDSTVATVTPLGISGGRLVGRVPVRDSTWVYAETPTHLTDSVLVHIVPPPALLQKQSGDNQTGTVGVALPLPACVVVRDGLAAPVAGVTVNWAVGTGTAGLSTTSNVSDSQGVACILVTPLSAGAVTVNASSGTLAPVTFAFTIATSTGPANVTIAAGNGQSALVGTAVPIAPAVLVTNAGGTPLADVSVTFAVTSGNGSLTGANALTAANGVATVGSWTLGPATGANTLSGTVAGLNPVTFTATGTSGPAAVVVIASGSNQTAPGGSALPAPIVAEVRDALGNPVSGVTVALAVAQGSITPPSGVTGAAGRVQGTWTLGTGAVNQTGTATVTGLTPAVFNATATFASPTILLSLVGGDRIPVPGTRDVQVTLSTAAGTGGVTVAVTSDNPGIVSVGTPGSIFIAQGQSSGVIALNGVSQGGTIVRGNAPGYSEGTLGVAASVQVISVPTTLNVAFGNNASLPIQISVPAPVGGTQVNLVSNAPGLVTVVTPVVTILEGQQTVNGTVSGTAPGSTLVTASAAGFGSAQSTVSTTANFNILEGSATLSQGLNTTVTIRFESQGVPVAAPSPGVTVTLTAGNPACLGVPPTVTIPTGLVQTTATLTYGGSAVTPCTTTLTASGTGITSDVINATVNPAPAISLFPTTVGGGLLDGTSGTLAAVAPAGGVVVRITSSDPLVALVSPNASTVGQPFIDVTVLQGSNSFSYYVHGLEGITDTATITATAPAYSAGTTTAAVVQPAVDVIFLNTTTTTLTADDPFQVRIGVPNSTHLFMNAEQVIRPGGTTVTASLITTTPAVAQLVTTAQTGATGTTTIVAGQARSPTTVAAGGITLDPLTPGSTTVSGTIPGFVVLPTASVTVVVSAPLISISNVNVGGGLQESSGGSLGAPAPPGGITVRVTSSDPAVAVVAPDALTPGAPFIDIVVPQTGTSFSYYVQGIEAAIGAVTITAATPLYTTDTATVTVLQPAVDVIFVNTTTTTLTADDPFQVRIGIPNATNQFMSVEQVIRAGGQPLTATLTSSDPAVGQLVTLARTGGSDTVHIPVGQARSPSTVAGGGIALDPLTAGTTTVAGTIPGLITLPSASVTVTISAPTMSISAPTVGAGLQENAGGSLGAPAPAGGVTIHLTSSDPAVALLSPNASTLGTPSLDVFVPQTLSSFSYYVQGVEGATGAVVITATTPLYTQDTATATVLQPAFDVIFLNTTTTTLTADDPFQVRIGLPNATNQFMAVEQVIRFGGTELTATVTTSAPGVAQLVSTAQTGSTGTVRIPVGQARSPSTVATDGIALDPLTAGTTTVSATIPGLIILPTASVGVTVTAPIITISQTTVGAGLQEGTGGSLSAPAPTGGISVQITSSNPAVALVAPNASTPGTASITVPVAQGGSSFSYYVQGVEDTTGTVTITATGSGFVDGTTTTTVLAPAFDVIFLNTTTTTLTADDPFQVRVGIPNATHQFMSVEQVIRAGGTGLTATITNTSPGVARLVTTADTGASGTVQIPVGQARSPASVATGGIALDPLTAGTTTVSGTIPGLIILPTASIGVTVTAPIITISQTTVGAGLQEGTGGSLGAPAPTGGIALQITSSNPAVALVAPNATTPGTASITVNVAQGGSSFSYYVQGVEGASGTSTITAETPLYTDGTATATVVPSALDIISLNANTTTLTADDPFQVRIGIPNASNQFMSVEQVIRAGGTALTATVVRTNPAVAQLVSTAQTGGTVTVSINPMEARSPISVAAGGMALDPLGVGTTTVSATIPGLIATTAASVTVTVAAPLINLSATTIGAGLQENTSASLGAPVPAAGLTVHIVSANPAVALVSPNATTPGTASIDIVLNPGATSFPYHVQGVEGATGIITITATALDYANGTTTTTVVQPALDITGLSPTNVVSAADDAFQVRVGIANATNQFLNVEQEVRAGAPVALTATVTTSNPAVATLATTPLTAGSVTVTIPSGQARSAASVAAGGVALDLLTAGTTTVTGAIAGYIAVTAATLVVTVNP